MAVAQTSAPVTVVEYYNATLDAYFITGRTAEQTTLDALPADFRRTGIQFAAAAASAAAPAGDVRICRFYISVASPASAFTNSPLLWTGRHRLRGNTRAAAGRVQLRRLRFHRHFAGDAGCCRFALPCAGQRADPRLSCVPAGVSGRTGNHRYTVSSASYEAMIAAGWAGEGVAFASPQRLTWRGLRKRAFSAC